MDIELILFDWGGTLADVTRQKQMILEGGRQVGQLLLGKSDGVANQLAFQAMAAEMKAAADPAHREVDLVQFLTEWTCSMGGTATAEQLQAAADLIGQTWVGSLDPLPGAVEAVATLRCRGYRIGVVSNCWILPKHCRLELDRQGIGPQVEFAVYSSELGMRKPSPVVYEEALRRAYKGTIPADCSRILFVGDSPTCDVIGPAKMGMKTALVTCKTGLWAPADYEKAQPDFRINAVSELPALLAGQSATS